MLDVPGNIVPGDIHPERSANRYEYRSTIGPAGLPPTATHAFLAAHETALSQLSPGGIAACFSDQCRPSQRSANGARRGGSSPPTSRFVAPTATQTVADVQDTPLSVFSSAELSSGEGWIRHRLPFQRSTNVPSSASPTAVQAVDELQDTLLSSVEVLPTRRGVCSIAQRLPSHLSASGLASSSNGPPSLMPTAMQSVSDTHETPLRNALAAHVGVGAVWTDQRLPSKRSTNTVSGPAAPNPVPV